jgi:hypothetical protein
MCAHLNNRCENCGDGMEYCGEGIAHGPGIWVYDFFCPNMPQRAITNTAKSKLTRIEPVTLNKKHPKNGRNTGTGKRVCVVGRLPTF